MNANRKLQVLLVAGAFLGAATARADWLVLRSGGGSVETRGAWTVEGPKVVFTSTRGVLSSVRATEVDIDASHALTAKKQAESTKGATTPTPTPKPAPVLVLTDKDFAKEPTPGPTAAEEGEAGAEGAPAEGEPPPDDGAAEEGDGNGAQSAAQTSAPNGGLQIASAPQAGARVATTQDPAPAAQSGAAPVAASAGPAAGGASTSTSTSTSATASRTTQRASTPSRGVAVPKQLLVVPSADSMETRVAHQMPGPLALRVASWSARPTGEEQLSIFGEVTNTGSRVTAAINVGVVLFDSEGARIGSTDALVSSTALMPNAQADFEAKFAGEPNFAEVQFSLKTVELELGKPASGEALDEPVGDEPHATARAGSARPRS